MIVLVLILGVVVLAAGVSSARADSAVKIGALKLSSSAPLFIGVDKGFF